MDFFVQAQILNLNFGVQESLSVRGSSLVSLTLWPCICFAGYRRHEKGSQIGWFFGPAGSRQLYACYLDAAGPSNAMSSLRCLSCIIYQFRGPVVVATCFIGRLLAVGHSSASSVLGSILLPGHVGLEGTATEAGALPGCFVAGALARWYQFGRTPIAE